MEDLYVVYFSELQAFLHTLKSYDDAFMNFVLGTLLDRLQPAYCADADERKALLKSQQTFLAVYRGSDLLITLVKPWDDFAWLLNTPLGVLDKLLEDDINWSIHLLAERLPSLIEPRNLESVIGPLNLANALVATWATKLRNLGIPAEVKESRFQTQISYATLATLPPLEPILQSYTISEVQTDDDANVVGTLAFEFRRLHTPRPVTLEEARKEMRAAVRMKQLWVCRADSEIVAFVLTGRLTPRTVAIRNVYVAPAYRKQGIAGAMVRGLCRWFLGAEPLGFDGAPSAAPPGGVVQAVCLNVREEHVARLYKRCGFLLAEDDRDPYTGVSTSFQNLWTGVKLL